MRRRCHRVVLLWRIRGDRVTNKSDVLVIYEVMLGPLLGYWAAGYLMMY
jgi:hypothetical protein